MKLAALGFGHMGSAIAEGAISAGILPPEDIIAADFSEQALEKASRLGIITTKKPSEAVKDAQIILLAVKPNNLEDLAKEVSANIPKGAIIVSICAGKRLETLSALFGSEAKLIRVMPNTPALVGEGMSALCKSSAVSEKELQTVRNIFSSFGKTAVLPEEMFDTVTAVSGSGPAYVYAFIEALAEYAEERGMSREDAKTFAAQTTLGAAKMVLSGGESPTKLKQNICTPGGTTVEAVKILDNCGFAKIIKDAAAACEEKSKFLAK